MYTHLYSRVLPPLPPHPSDGQSFMVDSSGDGLISIPESHRGEVRQQLEMLQRLAASALGVSS